MLISRRWSMHERSLRNPDHRLPRPVKTAARPRAADLQLDLSAVIHCHSGREYPVQLGKRAWLQLPDLCIHRCVRSDIVPIGRDGDVSLIDDRENDFSQEIFISPISRYSIILGKIVGETLVALVQGIGILVFGLLRCAFSLGQSSA